MTDDDPHLLLAIVLGLSLFLPLVVGGGSGMDAPAPPQGAIIEGSYLLPASPPFLVQGKVLAALIDMPPIMTHIAIAESSLNPRARNKKSDARGLWQVIPKSRRFCESILGRSLDLYVPQDNAKCAKILMSYFGLSPWKASEGQWKKLDNQK